MHLEESLQTSVWAIIHKNCLIIINVIIIIMYIYHALINTLSAHSIHINLNMIFYTHVQHSPTKTTHTKHNMERQTSPLHTHTHKSDNVCVCVCITVNVCMCECVCITLCVYVLSLIHI